MTPVTAQLRQRAIMTILDWILVAAAWALMPACVLFPSMKEIPYAG